MPVNRLKLRVPAQSPECVGFVDTQYPQVPRGVTFASTLGVTLEVLSTVSDLTYENFLEFPQTGFDIDEDFPPFSFVELLENSELNGARRSFTGNYEGREKTMVVEIITSYTERKKAIQKNLIGSADVEKLDSDICCICEEKYAVATTPSEPDHRASQLDCGHVFGGACVATWLKENDTCPLCRAKVWLPVPYRLRLNLV
ncbi:hypothetical protein NHQ30_006549 [Ciborinia camelliae]|nr:hypothetical protein NHQ30_006549 [Ciborinia camelliae]